MLKNDFYKNVIHNNNDNSIKNVQSDNANTIVQQHNTVANGTENNQSKNQSLSIFFRSNFQTNQTEKN
jgi:hypothetical protein